MEYSKILYLFVYVGSNNSSDFVHEDCSNDGSKNSKEETKAFPWLLILDREEYAPYPLEAAASIN